MVTVNITNKVFYLVVVFVGVLLVSGVVFAFVGVAPNPGHAVSEIQKCADGESLTMVNGDWGCAGSFGAFELKEMSTTYTAITNGIVLASSSGCESTEIAGWIDGVIVVRDGSWGCGSTSISMPVNAGSSWSVVPNGAASDKDILWWVPLN